VWARGYVRLGVLLAVLAASVLALLSLRVGLFDFGSAPAQARGAAFAAGCPGREAPEVRRVPPASVAALRDAVSRTAPARASREYESGTITTANLWSDEQPRAQPASGSPPHTVAAGYEMRWWSLNRDGNEDDVVADVLEFATSRAAEAALTRAASPRCRAEAAAHAGRSPAGSHELRWLNPDKAREWDVLFTRGARLYRVAYVPPSYPPANGPAQRAKQWQRAQATAELLGCAVADAACRAPDVPTRTTNLATLVDGSAPRASATAAIAREQARRYARLVNLRDYDVPGMVKTTREGPTEEQPSWNTFARCAGEPRSSRSVEEIQSAVFTYRGRRQDATVASTVSVLPSDAAASSDLDVLATDRARECVRRIYSRSWFTREAARSQLRAARISAAPLANPAPVSYRGLRPYLGAAIRVTIQASYTTRRGRHVQVPIYIDDFSFAYGRAVVALVAESVFYPYLRAGERYLMTKLVGRAQVSEA
jgi:hypothetical protein